MNLPHKALEREKTHWVQDNYYELLIRTSLCLFRDSVSFVVLRISSNISNITGAKPVLSCLVQAYGGI